MIRDHFGVEPCYYSLLEDQFIFGSNLPDILKHMPSVPGLNTKQIQELLIKKWLSRETYSDDTYYQSIQRAEPGHELLFDLSTQKPAVKRCFWDLKQYNQPIYYSDKRDYLAHFSALLERAIRVQCEKSAHVAIEFSGGLDSSAIVTAAFQKNIDFTLYTHIATPGGCATDDIPQIKHLVDTFGIKNIHYIDATEFDLITSMDEYAHYFAGAAPYNGFVFASNLHHAIAKQGHHTVLSGIGGDECVSSHASLSAYLPQLIREKGRRAAWRELHYHNSSQRQTLPQYIKNNLSGLNFMLSNTKGSLSEYEYNLLQGPGSHHLRMRIEYNAVLAKSLGFNYRYPLLYPPLVEFCYQLPLEQKRRNGINRCLIRSYLTQFFSSELYGKQSKSGSVTPATLEKVSAAYRAGRYQSLFNHLSFQKECEHIRKKGKENKKYPFLHDIPAYMFKAYWDRAAHASHHKES